MNGLVTTALLLFALAGRIAALPVIFGYPTSSLENEKKSAEVETSNENGLFVASVNNLIRRPITLKSPTEERREADGNSITYTENGDFNAYVPVELHAAPCDEVASADRDFHPSYRRLVTRTIKEPHERYANFYATAERSEEPPTALPLIPLVTSTKRPEDVEECFGNSKHLPRATIRKMNKRRRKMAQAIRRLNKLQRTYCLGLSRRSSDVMQGKCSAWREEKMSLYVKMLRLTHCTRGRARID
ncbi:hypothetical protein M3Y99_00903200 [Aphelenchoides fujianensis]|nr:hypothetical protein M3Y99_00903200 [Aphelenchoides fujianensis]